MLYSKLQNARWLYNAGSQSYGQRLGTCINLQGEKGVGIVGGNTIKVEPLEADLFEESALLHPTGITRHR